MRTLTSITLILFLSLLSFPNWSETLTMDDLVERNGLFYEKFTDVPFTGKANGKIPDSTFVTSYENGKTKKLY